VSAKRAGKSIRIFLVDGSVGGLRTAEILNWTGHVIAAQRSDLGELLNRDEVKRTGTYILLGDDQAYIGEADVIGERLRQHNRAEPIGKDFWTDVLVVTSKDANLTKAHARYLEARFISIALEAGRVQLTNGTNPEPPSLPEADASDMEYFISQVQIVLPVLGVNLLRGKSEAKKGQANQLPSGLVSPVFVMSIPGGGSARAQEVDGEFTVLEGSQARQKWASKELSRGTHARQELRDSLIAKGILVQGDKTLRFAQNWVFTSPSAAAAVIVGTETHNGRQSWKVEGEGISYGAWQERNIVSQPSN
jgi:hypothetical protein